ncbi:MAG: birA [Gammaproteobacteria bacterium]|jgi:BirA family biotin operon repressor/biotin-[acetyl-CoA-carboxylase] ligase|nr:birA [Gammaproteobacteria bacterium]
MPLNISAIRSHLPDTSLHHVPITLYQTIDSTNTQLKRELSAATTIALPHVCLAEQQTAGRGQADKQWYSPTNKNIYLSIAFAYTQPLHTLEGFSLVTGLALVKALSRCGFDKDIRIKWPNDIFHQGQKLAGILIETITQAPQQIYIVAGMGLNVNMTSMSEDTISRPWTSLASIFNQTQDRNKLTAHIIEQFFSYLALFEQAGLPAFIDQWEAHDFLKGKEITLSNANRTCSGIAAGINTRGQLIIQTPKGMTAHSSGNVMWR